MDFDANLFQYFSALKLEKEYSREKAAVDKVISPLEEYEKEYEDLTEGEDVSGEESEERSGWDFFKSVIRTNLGPEVVEPDIPEESKTKKRSRPKVVVGKKRKVKKGKSDAVRSSTEKADFDMTEENEEKMETKMEEEMETTTLPPCSELLPIDIERGFKCYNDTEVWTRYVLIKQNCNPTIQNICQGPCDGEDVDSTLEIF